MRGVRAKILREKVKFELKSVNKKLRFYDGLKRDYFPKVSDFENFSKVQIWESTIYWSSKLANIEKSVVFILLICWSRCAILWVFDSCSKFPSNNVSKVVSQILDKSRHTLKMSRNSGGVVKYDRFVGLRYRGSTLIVHISAYMWHTDSFQYSKESY